MAPLIVLVAVFLLTSLASLLGLHALDDVLLRLRIALAAMFLLTASAHWGSRRADLVRMVPPVFARPELWVTLTGVAELLGAVGLLVLPRLAAAGLSLLLLAMFPANVHAAREHLTIGGRAVMGVLPRALLQLLFLACTVSVLLA